MDVIAERNITDLKRGDKVMTQVEREIVYMTNLVVKRLSDPERRILSDVTLESLTTDGTAKELTEKIRQQVLHAVQTVYPQTTKQEVDKFVDSSLLKAANLFA